ncbi:galactokinase [Brevibacillus sp. SYP-B805]|uniref:galactokinase n=1 Tax=Brevibacillus sp. SYP-B805 TaxID=1578199 RepID=UPI0013E9B1D1|nr:galactokinase [Brevibacillus sp. SYP-B805]NGQ96798.1 galactokinase [Brevibacillus sp. SYP-B805]
MGMIEQFVGPGGEPFRIFFAPGRVNLIGEHTDYTGGYVFPAALDCGTWVAVRPSADGRFRFFSTGFAQQVECTADELAYRPEDGWSNYPKGVVWHLCAQGVELPGCELIYHGNIPNGAGLSSSASITLATAYALSALADSGMSKIDLIKLAQRVENEYLGVNCGIMDQFAVGMGKAGQAMLLRCQTLEYRYVPLALGDYRLVIINSNKRRELAESKYNERRAECEEGFRIVQAHLPHRADLGSVTVDEWESVRQHIPSAVIRNRLEHVVRENDRVQRSAEALVQGDLHTFGHYMKESHQSLRQLYEVSGKELDALVEAAAQVEGCIGARMTGAGFGGCTVNLVHHAQIDEFRRRVEESYRGATGLTPEFYFCEIGDGVREIDREAESCPF